MFLNRRVIDIKFIKFTVFVELIRFKVFHFLASSFSASKLIK